MGALDPMVCPGAPAAEMQQVNWERMFTACMNLGESGFAEMRHKTSRLKGCKFKTQAEKAEVLAVLRKEGYRNLDVVLDQFSHSFNIYAIWHARGAPWGAV